MPGLHSGETFTVPRYTQRRSTAFGPIIALVSNANATYHSFNAEARLHTRAFQLRGSYTFCKGDRLRSAALRLRRAPTASSIRSPTAMTKSLSSLDCGTISPAIFSSAPRFTGVRTPCAACSRAGRWPPSLSAASGAPYSYNIFGGTALTGGRHTINGSGGATYLPTLGRNTLRLPMRGRVDMRMARGFAFREHVRAERLRRGIQRAQHAKLLAG